MGTAKTKKLRNEGGFAVIELAVAIPLIVVILAGLCDLSVWVRTFMLSNEAATAAAASFMHADSAPSASALKESALSACPDIEGCGATLSVKTERQAAPSTYKYTHITDTQGEVNGSIAKTKVKVTCSVRRGWTSFIGPLITGGDCVARSSRSFVYEEVAENGWGAK